jgi:hypothetical protein
LGSFALKSQKDHSRFKIPDLVSIVRDSRFKIQ